MAAFNVSDIDLTDWGYPDKTSFIDPMMSLFRAKPYTGTDLGQIKDVLLPYFQNLDAYPDSKLVEDALDDYWLNGPKPKTSSTVSSTATSTGTPSTLVTSTLPSTPTPLTSFSTNKPASTAKATSTKCSNSGKGKVKRKNGKDNDGKCK